MSETTIKDRHKAMLDTALGDAILIYLNDPDVIEVMANPNGAVFIERLSSGKEPTDICLSAHQSKSVVQLVAAHARDIAHDKSPMVASELPYQGARFQGWLPPVVSQATFAIRKKAINALTLGNYVKSGALDSEMAQTLKTAVLNRENIIIAGGTSSGKTTFANALLALLADQDDRLVVLEDLPELQIHNKDTVSMVTSDEVSMRQLVKGALRMRPDRIIIGEVRDGSALELLKAWNTGHPGGLCTIHANSAQGVIARLEDLILEVSAHVPSRLINEAVHWVIYMEKDGNLRRVKSVLRVE